MILLSVSRTRRRRLGVAAAAGGLLAALLTAAPAAAIPDPGTRPPPRRKCPAATRPRPAPPSRAVRYPARTRSSTPPTSSTWPASPRTCCPAPTRTSPSREVRLRRQLRRLPHLRHQQPGEAQNGGSGAVPRVAERHLRLRRPALPVHGLLAQRQQLQQHHAARHREVLLGGHEGLRHQRQAQPALRRGRRDRLRLAHPHAGSRPQERVRLRLLLLAQRGLPGLPAAARRHLRDQGPAQGPAQGRRGRVPVLFPGEGPDGGGNPGAPTNPGVSKTTGCHDITVLPSKDLAAGACMGDGILFSIKDPERPKVIDRVRTTSTSRSGTRRRSTRGPTRSSSPTSWAAAARPPATRRSVPTAARTASTTSSARATAASWSSAATTRSPPPGGHRELRGAQRLADPGPRP